jgi:hypothetical protein
LSNPQNRGAKNVMLTLAGHDKIHGRGRLYLGRKVCPILQLFEQGNPVKLK